MSCADPLSPTSTQLSFLPHAPRTPPATYTPLGGTRVSRSRSNTATSAGSLSLRGGNSISAPTSPAGKLSLPQGLAPLSTISPTNLDPRWDKDPDRLGHYFAPKQYRVTPSQPLQNRPAASFRPNQYPYLSPANINSGPSRVMTRRSNTSSSSDDTETEVDSDSTFVPGRVKSKHSLSQPDLTALQSWAGDVARGQAEEKRVRALRKTPPRRPLPLGPVHSALSGSSNSSTNPNSKSQPSLTSLRRSPSPRQSTSPLTPLTPVLSPSSSQYPLHPEYEIPFPRTLLRTTTGSSDADADASASASSTDPDSPSSGSITFSPKRRTIHTRRRNSPPKSSSLGLTLSPDHTDTEHPYTAKDVSGQIQPPLPKLIEKRLKESTLFSLRLLAVVPSLWGIAVLLRALVLGGWWVEVWPWGADLTREALERLVVGSGEWEGTWRRVSRGDMIISIAWVRCEKITKRKRRPFADRV
jgi:hypothetical protein